jgi:hypothetical protein
MCRNIKMLFNFDPPVTPEEIQAASLQFVRKISGFNKPSKANEKHFNLRSMPLRAFRRNFCAPLRPTRLLRIGKRRRHD